jgi:hypothetical protein
MIRKLLCLSVLSLYVLQINAQRVAASEIFYQQIDSFKYTVTANLYRKCETDPLNAINAYVYADSLKISMNFKRISILNISDTCGNPCNIQNKKSNSGIEKHTYIDTIDFKKAPYKSILTNKICAVFFGIHQDIRDTGLSTMNDSLLYLDAMVNICHGGKFIKSPEFNIKPKNKTVCNQPNVYNPGILNFEPNDSLGFELSRVENNKGINTPFKGSFTLQYPLTPYCPPAPGVINCRPLPNAKPPRGFYFDKEDCNTQFTSTKCNEKSIIKYRINQYRYDPQTNKNELIGYVQREMIFQSFIYKDNNPPFFIGPNKHGVCEDNKICFKIKSSDDPFLPSQTKADSIDMKWNFGIPNASFKILDSNAREKEGEFCYIPKNLTHRPRTEYFAVTLEDRNCHSSSSYGYTVTTFPKLISKPSYENIKGCNMVVMNNKVVGDSNFSKTKLFSTYIVRKISPQKQVAYWSAKFTDTFRFFTSGRYVIESYIRQSANCYVPNYDTLDLEATFPLDFNKTDSLVCNGDSILLGNKDYNQNLSKISWEFPIGNKVLDSSNTFLFVQNGNKNTVRMRYQNKLCNLYQDVNIYTQSESFETNYNDTSICKNSAITLRIKTVKPNTPFKTIWISNAKDSTFNKELSNLIIDSSKTIKVILIKNPKCVEEKTIIIDPRANPNFIFADSVGCLNDSTLIKPQIQKHDLEITKYVWRVNNFLYNFLDSQISVFMNTNKNIKLEITDKLGCKTNKEINYKSISLPDFFFEDSIYCSNKNLTIQPIYNLNNRVIQNYQWFLNNQKINTNDSFISLTNHTNQLLKLTITDIKGCKKTKQMGLKPILSINYSLIDSANCKIIHPYLTIQSNEINSKTKIEWWIDGKLDTSKQLKYFNAFTKPLNINVKVYDSFDCVSEKNIVTTSIIRPKFTFPNLKFCANQIVSFQPSYSSTKPITYYNWFANGENMYYPDNKYLFKTNDSIFLKHIIKDSEGCIYADSVLLKPTVPVVKIKGDTSYNINGFVKLEADQVFNSYLWNNNTTLKTNHFPAKNLGPPGIYPIQLIASYNSNCKDTATVNLRILPSSNLLLNRSTVFKLYPNPSEGLFTIETSVAGPVEIHNINGKLLLNSHIQVGENSLNLDTFSNGIYFLKFEGKAYKLVLQR